MRCFSKKYCRWDVDRRIRKKFTECKAFGVLGGIGIGEFSGISGFHLVSYMEVHVCI